MRAALVALAVVLAGCPAIPDSTPTAGVTPAAVPETQTYPPGVTESGVTAPDALADAHSGFVANTSYTIVSNRTIRYRNGTLASRLDVRVRLAADRQFLAAVETAGPSAPLLLGDPPARARFWSNGSVYVRSLTAGGPTRYNEFTPPDAFVATWRYWRSTVPFGGQDGHDRETISGLFGDIPTAVAGRESVDGTTVYRLVGDSARAGSFAKVGSGPVGNVSLEAQVSVSGVVRRFDLSYDTTMDGRAVTVHWTLRYLDVGNTTAERPPWYDRAVEGS